MSKPISIYETKITSLEFLYRGKVRDIYKIDDDRLLVVQTDRLSAFDVILPDPIPGKGCLLTDLSVFWFKKLSNVISNHWLNQPPEDFVTAQELSQVAGRAMVVRRLKPLPVEAIVRGYLAGSGWKEYQQSGSICGIALPPNLREAEQLPKTIFTPSTKADIGDHDENISYELVEEKIGEDFAGRIRNASCKLYEEASAYALERGIIIADTKFEFGTDSNGKLYLIDEALTSDSSRFWPLNQYAIGASPPSFDKQFVRDWLESISWDKKPPAPDIPQEIAEKTAAKYLEALTLLTK
ncbi:MAG: phosphoribosylaminoimidazolesuccinocarboxamide synthase [Betaproteobacteria bacterium]|jgi:phosphoribosylaminoimidazole-succinocarboxamide synthase|nr:phosphoribosylaminoimidazolesuccinocarboxamide synthase [Betaproteobacteria bacterium]